jgi:hypothetical protein
MAPWPALVSLSVAFSGAARDCTAPAPWDTRERLMPRQDPIAARRLLVAQVRDLATGVGLAIRTARALHLPVEPGVPAGRDALILWAHLLDDVVPDA